MNRPRSVLAVSPEKGAVSVCAWCADKEAGERWTHDRGYVASHTVCPVCQLRLLEEINANTCNDERSKMETRPLDNARIG